MANRNVASWSPNGRGAAIGAATRPDRGSAAVNNGAATRANRCTTTTAGGADFDEIR
ncbi:hypothetical protein BJA01nite_01570 [Bradyrhizobium japonicum]|nr:hypothetical protein BJ6T_52790 [Bradyrhizobium japonicum USDA 6]GEC42515.1 hypothetical protein BJA01nite_01570 [Bradyrhizobium japonicum]